MRPVRHPAALVNVLPTPPPGTVLADVYAHLASAGAPPYRYHQLVLALQRGAQRFDDVSELPRSLRDALTARFGPTVLPLELVAVRSAEQVEKVLFETRSGARLETVRSRYRAGWSSVCVSTQAGCGLGCSFCATGAIGLARNLTADEICAQVVHRRWAAPDSVAFMGMGEALANPHVFTALELLTTPGYGGLSPRRITVSTVGFAPSLERLTREHPQVTITLSVHSPFPAQRAELVPLERRFSLAENLAILDRHVVAVRRKVYLAYLLIAGVNDSEDHLRALAQLVTSRARPELFHVSVIRYNDASGADPSHRAPSAQRVDDFVAQLRALGVRATRRQQFGASIDAACGQLHARSLLRNRRPS
ncbi:radical SAM protein [Sandaracinus amylolyticus]|uniref:Ribosomal RNA large subunit methyltransferase N n=1 Tax=Sandaracinus amylolyticus TaxID=927083 RepID=A0A0F6W270_9BACT|nr:radical SAM protein [Sandaracinus amylolyticus]AKF05402.1 Ribosomal RNA large subunit methyltransferase N [Sandaracinus amylolyticus]